ncbi:MAG: LCP family protein [Chloroflexi bacterium]|nr:LCP family protein [Chloroflexota bacterium]
MTTDQPARSRLLATALLMTALSGCTSAVPTATTGPSATPGASVSGPPSTTPTAGPTGGPQSTPPASRSSGPTSQPSSSSPTATPTASASPTPAPTSYPPIAGLEQLLGTDGRFTVLLLGSDARAGLGGERTDTIMVLSIVPTTGRVSVVSLPRDVETVPIGPGRTYRAKVTGLYQSFRLDGADEEQAAQQTREALAYAFGTEIDRYVFIGFEGVKKLVDAVGGVDITLERRLDDPSILVRPGLRGLHLKRGVNHLDGATALAFARVRKIDTDYDRTRRQQVLMMAAGEAVISRGLANLPALIGVAAASIRTDIPLDGAPALFELVQRADLLKARKTVLGPRKFASLGASRYSIVMIVPAVRAWFDTWLAPVGP